VLIRNGKIVGKMFYNAFQRITMCEKLHLFITATIFVDCQVVNHFS